jgi:hypothetical protein
MIYLFLNPFQEYSIFCAHSSLRPASRKNLKFIKLKVAKDRKCVHELLSFRINENNSAGAFHQ